MKLFIYTSTVVFAALLVSCSSPEEKRKQKVSDAIEHASEKAQEGSEKTLDFIHKKEKEIKEKMEE